MQQDVLADDGRGAQCTAKLLATCLIIGVLRNVDCSPWMSIALLKISGWECVCWHSRAHDFFEETNS